MKHLLCGFLTLAFVFCFEKNVIGQVTSTIDNTVIEGNDIIKKETRNLDNFANVDFFGAYEIIINHGQKQQVTVTADENILPLITTKVSSEKLTVSLKRSVSTKKLIKIMITVPNISNINVSGASIANISGVNNSEMNIEISGTAQLTVDGKSKNVKLGISGSGSINSHNLKSQNVAILISGTGDIKTHCSEKLSISIQGMGSVVYFGNPSSIDRDISGLGTISQGD